MTTHQSNNRLFMFRETAYIPIAIEYKHQSITKT